MSFRENPLISGYRAPVLLKPRLFSDSESRNQVEILVMESMRYVQASGDPKMIYLWTSNCSISYF